MRSKGVAEPSGRGRHGNNAFGSGQFDALGADTDNGLHELADVTQDTREEVESEEDSE